MKVIETIFLKNTYINILIYRYLHLIVAFFRCEYQFPKTDILFSKIVFHEIKNLE